LSIKGEMKMKTLLTLLTFSLTLTSCITVDIQTSKQRPERELVLEGDGWSVTPNGQLTINKGEFVPAGVTLTMGALVIVVDPAAIHQPKLADVILISHAHPDHFSVEDIKLCLKEGTTLICPASMRETVIKSLPGVKTVFLNPGEPWQGDTLRVIGTPAYNNRPVFLWITAHPKEDRNLGFLISNNNTSFFYVGDSDVLKEWNIPKDLDLVIYPTGGDNLTMSKDEAAEWLKLMEPKQSLPVHFTPL